MSSALNLISLETANMGKPLFYYKSFHKKGNNYYTRDNNNVEVAFKLLHDPEYGSEKKYKAGFTHREPGNLAFVLSLYSLLL